MRVCPECHAVVREMANYCDHCGHPFGLAPDGPRAGSPLIPSLSAQEISPGTCSSCGYRNVPGEMFCQNCGVQLPPVASASPPPPLPASLPQASETPLQSPDRCPGCGHPKGPDDVFCQNCGLRLAPAAQILPPQPSNLPEPVTIQEQPRLRISLVVSVTRAAIVLDMDRDEWLVGRSDPLRGIFPEVDLAPHGGDKSGVSRRHARLLSQSDQRWISDLNSTNFTFLNGEKLQPGVLYPLKPGDEIRFGLLALNYFEEIAA